MFNRSSKREASASRKLVKDLMRLQSADELFAQERRETLLLSIRSHMDLSDSRYQSLAQSLLLTIVQYYQQLPESTASYYQHAGGLLDHALQRTDAALTIFKSYMQPDGDGKFSEIQLQWQYALFTAALLQGIGKLFIDYQIQIYDAQGTYLKHWNPLRESMLASGSYYHYEFNQQEASEMRSRLNILLARQLMPASGFNWIAANSDILAIWLALLDEDLYRSGTLGCILDNADAVVIQHELNRMHKRYGGKLRRLTRLGTFNDHSAEAQVQLEQQTGIQFLQWVQQALAAGTLMLNKSPLFVVPGGIVLSVDIFKLFIREHPEFKNWQAVQKGFTSLGLHEHAADGSLLSKFEQHKNQHVISGIALGARSAVILPQQARMLHLGSGEVMSLSTVEMINQLRYQRDFQASAQPVSAVQPLASLSGDGQWLATAPPARESSHPLRMSARQTS
ncbi:MAG: TraI domain-containing protein [Legionellaceae bacterium]|nr:TraI domain-containing protein [Legionellaceae bacterium]